MAETALDRVRRILDIIPLAARDGGIGYDELAGALGVDRRQLDRDLAEIHDRDLYHSALTAGDDIRITLGADRIEVWTAGHLRRPTRLAPGEAAALDLGLRILAAERDDPALLDRMAGVLARLAWSVPGRMADHVVADGDPGTGDAIRALLLDAARLRRPVAFRYLKPDAVAPVDRGVEPWAVVYGQGRWYVVGRDPDRDDVRIFRVDRILEARAHDAAGAPARAPAFQAPADFDPADYMDGGRVYRADDELEVVVRYAGRIAPWLLERGEGEAQDDGGVVVRHRVADPAWLVRHVLQYGPGARVIEPGWVAELVRAAARRVEDPDGMAAPAGG